MTNPIFVEGIKFHMDGNKDAYFVEGGQLPAVGLGQADLDPQGAVIDLDGKSKNCAWNATGRRLSMTGSAHGRQPEDAGPNDWQGESRGGAMTARHVRRDTVATPMWRRSRGASPGGGAGQRGRA